MEDINRKRFELELQLAAERGMDAELKLLQQPKNIFAIKSIEATFLFCSAKRYKITFRKPTSSRVSHF